MIFPKAHGPILQKNTPESVTIRGFGPNIAGLQRGTDAATAGHARNLPNH